MTTKSKFWLITILIIVLGLSIFIYFKFFFVYTEGVRSGHLNKVTREGYIFKTYEGRLIQTGFHSETQGTLGSNYFEFSIVDEKIAQDLMKSSDHELILHYKKYLGVLPWRGNTVYIVDSILQNNITENPAQGSFPIQ